MDKIKIVLSDLHLGAGRADTGNFLEDFTQDAAFADLISQLAQESTHKRYAVEIIFAGDTFEFLQVPALPPDETFDPTKTYRQEQYAASDAMASRRKMEVIIEGHPLFFQALKEFLASPDCRVCFIKGNHDINLHWESVQSALREALGATGSAHDRLTFAERCISREGIYVEHGSQYLEWLNRWPDFEQPHDPTNPAELYLPPGSRFVIKFFNEAERLHYWLDGIKPITALIWYLFALDPRFALQALQTLLRLAPSLLWPSMPPTWLMRSLIEAREQIMNHLDDPATFAMLTRDPYQRATFYNEAAACLNLYGVPGDGEMLSYLGSFGHAVLPRGQEEQRIQRDTLAKVAAQKRLQEGAYVVVFGHVHEPCAVPLEEGIYLNTGTWTWSHDMSQADYATWQELFRHPERFTTSRRLTYARITYDAQGLPHGQLVEHTLTPPRVPWWRSALRWILGKRS